jgi:hypothetical protein
MQQLLLEEEKEEAAAQEKQREYWKLTKVRSEENDKECTNMHCKTQNMNT